MRRSKRIATGIRLSLILAVGCTTQTAYRSGPEEAFRIEAAPNIVLLISDDDDYENFGFMGNEIAQTPTLDSLAETGIAFTHGYTPAPLCRPSLASLLSGKLPQQHGIYTNYLERDGIGDPSGGLDSIVLSPTDSLPNRLKAAGYATFATGKFWEGDPRKMGFTHGTVDTSFAGFSRFVRQGQDELFNFIDAQHQNKPLFIWWAPFLPHIPTIHLLDISKD